MKLKHNKKRNTAFLYETLIRGLTKAIVEKNKELKDELVSILKEHFEKNSLLYKELKLYKTLCETYDLEPHVAEKLVYEIKREHLNIDKKQLFNEQSVLIKKINTLLSRSSFSNFLPNYKSLATVYQIFNEETPIKKRVLLENALVKKMASKFGEGELGIKPIDNIVYKSFVNRFNSEYSPKLLEEQKKLLNRYVSSFVDNGIELKIFLNEEISRLRQVTETSLNLKDVLDDKTMVEKTKKVLDILESFKKSKIDKKLVMQVLKIQSLAKEIQSNGN